MSNEGKRHLVYVVIGMILVTAAMFGFTYFTGIVISIGMAIVTFLGLFTFILIIKPAGS